MRGRDFDIVYGLHSNIPACCIVFYITEWENECFRNTPYARAVHADLLNYIPCPECLSLQRHNVLRLCEEECGRRCPDEYKERELTLLEHQLILNVNAMIPERSITI